MKCGKQIGAPSYHGQQRSVSQLGAEWIEDKAEGKGGRSLLKGWGASGAGVWRMRDACSPELGRVQQPSPPPVPSLLLSSTVVVAAPGCPEGCSSCYC